MKKLLKWGGIALIAIIVLAVIAGSGDDKSNNKSTTGSNSTASSNNKVDTTKTYGLNESVQDGDLTFTVTGVETAKTLGNQFTKKDAQGTFYIVTLKIENKGNKTATFDSSMAKVTDDQGREFERSIEGQTAKGMAQGNVDLFLQQIQPSLSVTGDLVFDLPADMQNPMLVVKGSLFAKGAKIKLQ